MIKTLEQILELAIKNKKKTLSVAVAQDKQVLTAVLKAVELGIVNAILVGGEVQIRKIAEGNNLDLSSVEIIDEKDELIAAAKAVELVTNGTANYIMKGMLGTADLLHAVLNKDAGLRGDGLLSHVMIYGLKNYNKLLFLTDGGMIPYPDLTQKIGILKNAVKIAHALEIGNPKVAPICAAEIVNPAMTATVDAAALTVMNKRGQIKGCIVDGPLGLDNAISMQAAEHKGIISPVAGDADILLVPNIESGNFLGKALTYFADAQSAGIIVGAKCPIVLVSRADSVESKLYSIALGSICSK